MRASTELVIIGEPSPLTMPPNRLPDPVLDGNRTPARTTARTAGRIVSVNIRTGDAARILHEPASAE